MQKFINFLFFIILLFKINTSWAINTEAENLFVREFNPEGKLVNTFSANQLEITADCAEFDEVTHKAIYSGDVIVLKDNYTLTAEKLIVIKSKNSNQIKTITAESKNKKNLATFKIKNEDKTTVGIAEVIIYSPEEFALELNGNAELQQEQYVVKGSRLIYYTNKQKLVAPKNNVRTKFIIKSENSSKKSMPNIQETKTTR